MTTDPQSGVPDASHARAVRIPIWKTVATSYRSVFGDLGAVLTRAWPWWVICLLAVYGLHVGFTSIGLDETLGGLFGNLVWMIGGTAFLVRWYRHVLLDEHATSRASLSFGRRELRFLGIGFLFLLALFGPMIAVGLSTGLLSRVVPGTGIEWLHGGLVLLATYLAFFALGPRLSLAFPIVALDGPPRPLAASWRLSRGQTLRLMGGFALTTIPFSIASDFIERVSDATEPVSEMVVTVTGLSFALIVLFFAQIAVTASLTCEVYARLTGYALPQRSSES